MSPPFTFWACPRGHRWETTLPTTEPVVCPICGTPGVGDGRTPTAGDDVPTIGLAPAAAPIEKTLSADTSGVQIEGYDILGELGRGGMGVVYRARQRGLNRVVALKMVLAAEHAGTEQILRFRAEAEAVAQIQHPNIVQIFEVGEEAGRPYFSMEYVDGGTLAQKLQGHPQGVRASAQLIEAVARGIQAAHERGIVHRDLKPGNIMLAGVHAADGSSSSSLLRAEFPLGIPKITDFGLAKRLDSAGNTQTGAVLGTPSYMSPEQAAGRVKEIGPHSDIYSLGAILYELLTGRPPFRAESPLDTLMQVMREEPIPPSRLRPKLPRDLEVICLKCLRKQSKHRYPGALELAEDLRRFLTGEPIAARPANAWDRARHWVRRRPVLAAAMLVAALAFFSMAVEGATYHRKLKRALADMEREKNEAAQQRHEAMRRLVRLAVANGEGHLNDDDLLGALPWFAEALRLDAGDPEREEMDRIRLAAVLRQSPRLTKVRFHDGSVRDAAFCPSSQLIVSAGDDGFGIVEPPAGKSRPVQVTPGGAIRRVAFRHDSGQFLTLCEDRTVAVWDSMTGQQIGNSLKHRMEVTAAVFSPDGKHVLTACRDRAVRIWDVATSKIVGVEMRHDSPVLDAEFDRGGKLVAAATEGGTTVVWDVAKGEPAILPLAHRKAVRHVAFSPDGKLVLTASDDGTARLWEAATGLQSGPDLRHAREVTSARFSPDGKRVVTASADGSARVWDAQSGAAMTPALKHNSFVNAAEFSPDGRWVVTAGDDNVARVWDAASGEPVSPPLKHNGNVFRASFSRDGRHVLTASQDGMARIWEVALAQRRGEGMPDAGPSAAAIFSPDGKRKLLVNSDGTVYVLDSSTGRKVTGALAHDSTVRHASFSADGLRVLTTGDDRTARLWDAVTGQPIGRPMRHGSAVLHAALSPDGKRVATASADNTARVWSAETGKPISPPLKHNGSVQRVAFSPDGRAVLTASRDGTARMWDAQSGESLTPALAQAGWVRDALSAGADGRGWDLSPDRHPAEQLVRLAQWLSGQRIDATGGMEPLDNEAMRLLWDAMQSEQPEDLELPAAERVGWHRRAAAECEAAGNWYAAAFHLGELLQNDLGDAELLARRARSFAEQGDWRAARTDYAAALAKGADDLTLYVGSALAQLGAGDEAGYRRVCDAMRQRLGRIVHGEASLQLAWVCLLAADEEQAGAALELVRRSESGPVGVRTAAVRGAAEYRAGRYADALRLLQEGQSLTDPGDTVRGWLYLAMTQQRLGKFEEARRLLAQAGRWLESESGGGAGRLSWGQRLELTLLRAEATKLLATR